MRKLALLAAAAFAATAVPASATVNLCTGNNCVSTDANVLVTAATNQTVINGTFNSGPTTAAVQFTSSTDTPNGLNGNANGQADVSASDGLLNQLTFALTGGYTFGSATFNLFPLPGNNANEATTVTITYFDPLLGTINNVSINTNGQNFLGISGDNGERFISVGFTASPISDGIQDMRQLRLGGVAGPTPAVPEPATWAMMLLGFGAIGFSMRNRRKALLSQIA
jgi:hypothetical protein